MRHFHSDRSCLVQGVRSPCFDVHFLDSTTPSRQTTCSACRSTAVIQCPSNGFDPASFYAIIYCVIVPPVSLRPILSKLSRGLEDLSTIMVSSTLVQGHVLQTTSATCLLCAQKRLVAQYTYSSLNGLICQCKASKWYGEDKDDHYYRGTFSL